MASYEEEEISVKARLSLLQCPFTWEMIDDYTKLSTMYPEKKYSEKEEDVPDNICNLDMWMSLLLKCYRATTGTKDCIIWTQAIEEAEQLLIQMQQEPEMNEMIRAIEHIFYATKCFLLYDAERMDELREIIENICSVDDFNDVELSALYGCQSIASFKLYSFGIEKAIELAKKAIKFNEDYALWHFILATSVRRQRRNANYHSSASCIEQEHFAFAYAISKDNHIYNVYYLLMRFEKYWEYNKDKHFIQMKYENEREVIQLSKELLSKKPNNYKVLLKLARIFVRCSSDQMKYAKECLDAIQKIKPNDNGYIHYRGILHEECGEYKEALHYYNMAAENFNMKAEFRYIEYGWETGELMPLPHLLRMVKKYEQNAKVHLINIHLRIAIVNYSIHKNIPMAAEYFKRALNIDPSNTIFKERIQCFNFSTGNILHFLNNSFLPKIQEIQGLEEKYQVIKLLLRKRSDPNTMEELESL